MMTILENTDFKEVSREICLCVALIFSVSVEVGSIAIGWFIDQMK